MSAAVLESTLQTTAHQFARMNWHLIVADIRQVGCSGYQIARMMQVEWSTVQRWSNGSEPGWTYGHELLRLHEQLCGKNMTQLRLEQAQIRV